MNDMQLKLGGQFHRHRVGDISELELGASVKIVLPTWVLIVVSAAALALAFTLWALH
jgi:hypothetical protein